MHAHNARLWASPRINEHAVAVGSLKGTQGGWHGMCHHFPEAEGRGQARSQKWEKNFWTTNIFKGDLGVQFVAPVIYLVCVYSNSQATWMYEKTQTVFLLEN